MNSRITCPNCRTEIEITEAIASQLKASALAEAEAQLGPVRQRLKQQQDELARQEEQLQQKAEAVEEQVKSKLAQERPTLERMIRERVSQERDVELKDQAAAIAELKAKVQQANEKELGFLKKERELQARVEAVELEVTRRTHEQLEKVREQALKELDEQHRLRLMEKEQQVEGLRRQIDELKRKAEQGSQQAQGEVLEVALEELLRGLFPMDSIEPVPKGVRGADVIQRVFDDSGTDCGLILWESKRTRHWSKEWLPKLRDDLRMVGASKSIIVSEQLPEHIRHFGQVDGVWVASWSCVHPVAIMLREGLVGVAKSRRALDGQHTKMELVYNYLIGQEFYNRVSGVVEAFMTMRQELEAEKRALNTCWKKREKQLERVLLSTSGLYGDLQGIIGSTLPQIEGMSLESLEAGGKALPGPEESEA
ncbi:MAG TPA: DUF2130 domain-containing protein [Sedimentisphaerales bacterium]|nr:DUF2130 domain-containing protein [Sedimentisphaerales bacterium]HNU30117.1 DUF2130 domain-containing protein [Sedimentisphaerales bacterium]